MTRARDDERERRPRAEPSARPAEAPGDGVLALQRSAGNRAVAALLARAPDTKEKAPAPEATGSRVTLSDIGTIALESVSWGEQRVKSPPEREEDKSGEIHLSSVVGSHSPRLLNAATNGTPMDAEVVITSGGRTMRLKLKSAIVASYHQGSGGEGSVETWTLNYASAEWVLEGE